MKSLLNGLILLLAFLGLSGCSLMNAKGKWNPQPLLPESLGEKGIVVAEFQGLGELSNVDYDGIDFKGFFQFNEIRLARNHLGLVLPPGEYELTKIYHEESGMLHIRPINRKFKIDGVAKTHYAAQVPEGTGR
jgi:hypothetical protein